MDPAAAGRLISNPGEFLRVFSRMFGEPLTRLFKKKTFMRDHYGFVDPTALKDMWEKVMERAKRLGYTTETDFTKMDATVNQWMRDFEREIGQRAFAKEYVPLWESWHSKLYKKTKSKGVHGHAIELGASRRSGEYFTSLFNTILNFFYVVCCFVECGMTTADAIREAGLVGGDDGLHPNLPAEVAIRVAPMLGFIAKATQSNIGEPTSFLGQVRFRPGVFCYDPIRFVSKLSSTPCGANVPPFELAVRKFQATADLYPNVPLVGTISKAVLRLVDAKSGWRPAGGKTLKLDPKYDELCRNVGMGYQMRVWKELAQESGERFKALPFEVDYDEACGLIATRMGIDLATLQIIERAYDVATDFNQFPSHVIDLSGQKKAFKYPTIFQGNVYKGSEPTSGGSDKKSSSELITKDQEPIASRAYNGQEPKKSTCKESSCKNKTRRKKRDGERGKSPSTNTSTNSEEGKETAKDHQ